MISIVKYLREANGDNFGGFISTVLNQQNEDSETPPKLISSFKAPIDDPTVRTSSLKILKKAARAVPEHK